MLTTADIIRFADADPPAGQTPWVHGAPRVETIDIVASDPSWPARFDLLAARIRIALGPAALQIEHVGSTSVPDLPAKPVIDIDLTVADASDEERWLPQLESAGFELVVREPWWYEHRCLQNDNPRCNLHVFSPDCAEAVRHKIFRDWLRGNSEDRQLYAATKRAAATASNELGELVQDYNARKQAVIRAIYQRAFVGAGLLGGGDSILDKR